MKVVIIGSGAQGTGLAGLLVMEKDVEQLILADYSQASLDKAKQLIDSLGEKIQTKQILYRTVNAGSVEEVATLLEGSDICFPCHRSQIQSSDHEGMFKSAYSLYGSYWSSGKC